MMDAITFFGVFINVGFSIAMAWQIYKMRESHNIQMSYMLEKQEDFQNKLSTAGTVLKIFEDETQILKKRNEQNALKQRFQNPRQPR